MIKNLIVKNIIIGLILLTSTICLAQEIDGFSQAVALYNNGDYKNATEQFESIIKQSPNNVDALAYLGLLYTKSGNYPEAIKAFQKVIQLKPDDLSPYYNLGLAYYNNKNYEEAQAAFDVAQKAYGDNPDLLYYDALAHYDVGEVDETIKNLKVISQKHPDYGKVETRYLLALAYFYKGMSDDASEQFNTVVKEAPDYTNWDKQARTYIIQIEQRKKLQLKELSFSLYTNFENDSNVAYATTPSPADADTKLTLFGALNYRPVIGGGQNLKLGYSFYNLTYSTHTTSNLFGNMGEIAYNIYPFANTLLALKTNLNLYNLGGSPYLFNLPVDCRFTFKILPGSGAWSIAYIGIARDSYLQKTYEQQNANSVNLGLKQFLNDNLSLGYEGKNLSAQGSTSSGTTTDDYSYQSHQLNFSYMTIFPGAISLSFDGSYSLKNYLNVDSGTKSSTPTKRRDTLLTLSAVLSKTIFWELGLMLKANYLADNCNLTAAQSTLGYGSYSSTAFSLGLAKSF